MSRDLDLPVVTFRPYPVTDSRLESPIDRQVMKERRLSSPNFYGSMTSTLKHDQAEELSLDLEQSKGLSNALDRLKAMEANHERVTSTLRDQIRTLRDQQALSEKVHSLAVDKMREEHEAVVQRHLTASEELFHHLEEAEAALQQEKQKNEVLKAEFERKRSEQELEIGNLKGEIRGLKAEIENLKQDFHNSLSSQIRQLQQDYSDQMEAKAAQIRELYTSLQDKDSVVAQQGSDISKLRKVLVDLRAASGGEIEHLQASLAEVRQEVRHHIRANEEMRRGVEDWQCQTLICSKEKSAVEGQLGALRSRNSELEEQVTRLEKLVFGKSSRRV